MPTRYCAISGETTDMAHSPNTAASKWLRIVATIIPNTIAVLLENLTAKSKASNWVLSPISAMATLVVEIKSASNFEPKGVNGNNYSEFLSFFMTNSMKHKRFVKNN